MNEINMIIEKILYVILIRNCNEGNDILSGGIKKIILSHQQVR